MAPSRFMALVKVHTIGRSVVIALKIAYFNVRLERWLVHFVCSARDNLISTIMHMIVASGGLLGGKSECVVVYYVNCGPSVSGVCVEGQRAMGDLFRLVDLAVSRKGLARDMISA